MAQRCAAHVAYRRTAAGGRDPDRLGEPVVGLVVAACERDRDALLALIKHCVQRLEVSEDANLSMLAPRLKAFGGVDRWLGQTSSSPLLSGTVLPDTAEVADAPLQLVLGSALRGVVTDATLTDWSAAVRAALADMPLPDIAPTDGDVEPDEIELRLSGQRVARGVFRPELRRVPKRLWDLARGSPVAEDEDVQSEEDVLWLSADVIEAAGYRFEHLDFDTAAVRWIVDRCRSGFGLLFDADLQVDFLNEVATSRAGRDCLRRAGSRLVRAVFADLIVEGVPVASRDAVLEQLADIVPRVQQPDVATQREAATQKVREFLGTEICQSIADESGQVTTILLDDHVERALLDRIDQGRPMSPAEAIRLNAAIRRLAHRTAEWTAGPPPAIVTVSRLRRMLAVLLNRLGHRLPVLSFPEWDESFIDVPGGPHRDRPRSRDRTSGRGRAVTAAYTRFLTTTDVDVWTQCLDEITRAARAVPDVDQRADHLAEGLCIAYYLGWLARAAGRNERADRANAQFTDLRGQVLAAGERDTPSWPAVLGACAAQRRLRRPRRRRDPPGPPRLAGDRDAARAR